MCRRFFETWLSIWHFFTCVDIRPYKTISYVLQKTLSLPLTYMSVIRGHKISIIFQEHLVKQNKKNPGSKQVYGEQKQRQINSRPV